MAGFFIETFRALIRRCLCGDFSGDFRGDLSGDFIDDLDKYVWPWKFWA